MFKKNFIKICNQNNVAPTVVLKEIGLTGATFSKWDDDSVPRKATLQKLADYFGITVEALLADDPTPMRADDLTELDREDIYMTPLYETVSAGFGSLAVNEVIDYIPLYFQSPAEANETICIKVRGNSMAPRIENGDVIQVHKQSSVDSGSIAVVLVDGEEALVKKVIYDDNHIELHSFNSAYSTVSFRGADLMRIRVLGLVKNTIKSPKPHHIVPDLDTKIAELSEDLSPAERLEVEKFIAYIKSKRN